MGVVRIHSMGKKRAGCLKLRPRGAPSDRGDAEERLGSAQLQPENSCSAHFCTLSLGPRVDTRAQPVLLDARVRLAPVPAPVLLPPYWRSRGRIPRASPAVVLRPLARSLCACRARVARGRSAELTGLRDERRGRQHREGPGCCQGGTRESRRRALEHPPASAGPPFPGLGPFFAAAAPSGSYWQRSGQALELGDAVWSYPRRKRARDQAPTHFRKV